MTNNNSYDKDLVSILAHDLRTPISSARNYIDLALHSGPVSDKQRMMFERAMDALQRMEVLVDDVLEMSKIDSEAPLGFEGCNLDLIIREAVALLEVAAEKQQINLHVNVANDLVELQADVHRVRQVINNLLTNAIKYNREGGDVWVEAVNHGNGVQFKVTDSGYGIPEEDLEHIFDRFYRSRIGSERRIQGSGLGLAIVKSIVEKHGGTITVSSVLDEGTTFTVELPQNAS